MFKGGQDYSLLEADEPMQGDDDEEAEEYEAKPRTGEWKKESKRLPLRDTTGSKFTKDSEVSESEESDEHESELDDYESASSEVEETEKEETLDSAEVVIEAKEALARIAQEILESPEENVFALSYYANARLPI